MKNPVNCKTDNVKNPPVDEKVKAASPFVHEQGYILLYIPQLIRLYIWDSKEVWTKIIVVSCESSASETLSVVSPSVLSMADCQDKKRIGVLNECLYIDFGREIGLTLVTARKLGTNANQRLLQVLLGQHMSSVGHLTATT